MAYGDAMKDRREKYEKLASALAFENHLGAKPASYDAILNYTPVGCSIPKLEFNPVPVPALSPPFSFSPPIAGPLGPGSLCPFDLLKYNRIYGPDFHGRGPSELKFYCEVAVLVVDDLKAAVSAWRDYNFETRMYLETGAAKRNVQVCSGAEYFDENDIPHMTTKEGFSEQIRFTQDTKLYRDTNAKFADAGEVFKNKYLTQALDAAHAYGDLLKRNESSAQDTLDALKKKLVEINHVKRANEPYVSISK